MKKILLAVPVLLLFFTACEKDKEVSDNSYTPFIPATYYKYTYREPGHTLYSEEGYDVQGHLVKEAHFNKESGEIQGDIFKYEYDEGTNIVNKIAYCDTNGVLTGQILFYNDYNEKGQLIKCTAPGTTGSREFSYVYDETTGNLISAVIPWNSEFHERYYHYENENLSLMVLRDYQTKEVIFYIDFTYNNKGLLEKSEIRENDMSLREYYLYTYDGQGNKILRKYFGPNGEAWEVTEYTYDDLNRLTNYYDDDGDGRSFDYIGDFVPVPQLYPENYDYSYYDNLLY
jgi:hypothetical protein